MTHKINELTLLFSPIKGAPFLRNKIITYHQYYFLL